MVVRTVVFVGGGPSTALVLERIAANLDLDEADLRVHVVEPFEPGVGRIWRYDQSPLLKLNSMAADITMFTDSSVRCAGPAWEGPSLLEWCRGVAGGTVRDHRVTDLQIMAQVRAMRPQTFPTRRLHSHYLGWFWRRVLERLGDRAVVVHHRGTVASVRPCGTGDARWTVGLADGSALLTADAVVLAVGHTDTLSTTDQRRRAQAARRAGGWYAGPAYTNDLDYSGIGPGRDVLVAGMGLAFIDLMVLLFEGRGGRFVPLGEDADGAPRAAADDGGPLRYLPSGREPRLFAGSRRGVPYHSKITSQLRVAPTPGLVFLTEETVAGLLAEHGQLGFDEHLWPLISREIAYHWYRELFLGHPDRVAMPWERFEAAYRAAPWASAELSALVRAAVPRARYVLDLHGIDRPLEGLEFEDGEQVQAAVVRHVEEDLALRTSPEHSETLALFIALLRVYLEVGRLVPVHRLDDESQRKISGWWHGFFSFVDSGPPAHRLQELLALHRAGLIRFLGPDLVVATDPDTGVFRARSRDGGPTVQAGVLVEARLPGASVAESADPVLQDLHVSGTGTEQRFETEDGAVLSTGKLVVESDGAVTGRDGTARGGLYALGAFTSAWGTGAFARPHADSAPFRVADALARTVLWSLDRA